MSGINSLQIEHFKAFDDSKDFQFLGRNVLIYGENGSGKTSVYDALRMAFFSNRLESLEIKPSMQPEEANEIKRRLYDSYRHVKSASPFSIKIDTIPYTSIARDDYKLFLITHDDFELHEDEIKLSSVLGKVFFDYGTEEVGSILSTVSDALEVDVNRTLQEYFSETIQIHIEKGDDYRCILSDLNGALSQGKNLSRYFNEGKLHLVLLIIYITTAILLKDVAKQNVIVLDDFITSLDAANRVFVVRYLFEMVAKDASFQTIVLTHNVSFYNLIKHYVSKHLTNAEKANWQMLNFYNYGEGHRFYPQDDDTLERVEHDLQRGTVPVEDLGNRVRKLFEAKVIEISKIIVSGGIEESGNILGRMFEGKPLYYKEANDVFKLIDELSDLANSGETDGASLSSAILATIGGYKTDPDLENLRKDLRSISLFQKVSLHPTSHGSISFQPASVKEIKESIVIIQKLNDCIRSIKGRNLANM